jgi:hypothetical protein
MRWLLVAGLLLTAGCVERPSGQPPEVAMVEPVAGVTEIQVHAIHDMSPGMCVAGEGSCLIGNPSSIVLAVLPNMTLLGFDLLVDLPAGSSQQATWNLPCVERACPRPSLGTGHGSFPMEIHVHGLALSSIYLRLDLNNTDGVHEKPNPIDFARVDISGVARVVWGPPMVEVIRDVAFSVTTLPCLDAPTCFPLATEHDEFDLVGVATKVAIRATWDAASPSEENLRFYVVCQVGCEAEFNSDYVASPADVGGSVHLMGQRIWLGTGVAYAGIVGGAHGLGTTVEGTLRLTELVVASPATR